MYLFRKARHLSAISTYVTFRLYNRKSLLTEKRWDIDEYCEMQV